MRHLSEHFSYEEAIKSQTALRHGIANHPPDELIPNGIAVCEHILEPVRAHYGVPFSPNSFYRCLQLNRLIGSKDTSQHVTFQAVDFEVPGHSNMEVARWVEANLKFDQLILEMYADGVPYSGWVHVSYRDGPLRQQVLTIPARGPARPGLRP